MDNVDSGSRILNRALDIIFTKYPARTGLGVILGCTLGFTARLFAPALKSIEFADFSGAPWWGWITLGILIMHSPTITSLFKQKAIGNDAIDQALDLIDRGNFTQAERRQQYRNLIERVSSNVALSQTTKRTVKKIEKSITEGETASRGK
ncbi:hypothetical protein [Pseudoduganella sp. RAF53_2]|uniref:hypothetical protein n=1 Tax=unclassified Pseudoduganella TaxID=2637179 RepID=UPI003F9AE066